MGNEFIHQVQLTLEQLKSEILRVLVSDSETQCWHKYGLQDAHFQAKYGIYENSFLFHSVSLLKSLDAVTLGNF